MAELVCTDSLCDPLKLSISIHMIIFFILVAIAIIAIISVFVLYKRKQACFTDRTQVPTTNPAALDDDEEDEL